ncbi:MAG TPA: hypothetical protein VKM94_12155 [Blastocatellia bacterium]|nr:hypothetical protein [Blastocatellia bacterium]
MLKRRHPDRGTIIAVTHPMQLPDNDKGEQEVLRDSGSVNSSELLSYRLMALELEDLREQGTITELKVERGSAADRTMFEVALIDALSKWPRSDQHLLRSTLIRQGYDEQCRRRLMCEAVSDRVRASTLLNLLRPQSRPTGDLDPHFLRTPSGSLIKPE